MFAETGVMEAESNLSKKSGKRSEPDSRRNARHSFDQMRGRVRTPRVILTFVMTVAYQPATLDAIRKSIFSFVFRAAKRLRFDLKEK